MNAGRTIKRQLPHRHGMLPEINLLTKFQSQRNNINIDRELLEFSNLKNVINDIDPVIRLEMDQLTHQNLIINMNISDATFNASVLHDMVNTQQLQVSKLANNVRQSIQGMNKISVKIDMLERFIENFQEKINTERQKIHNVLDLI